jgi:hypothetical protein
LEIYTDILDKDKDFGICGTHIQDDAIHVGIYWNYEGENKILHFLSGDNIPLEDIGISFSGYMFNSIHDFEDDLIPSLSAVADLISNNSLNQFIFNKEGIVYDGGKFEIANGNYTISSESERVINCAAFVVAILNTYNYKLVDWSTWPNPTQTTYLDTWLTNKGIPRSNWCNYYRQTKALRGKHVIVSPETISKPSIYDEANSLADELINTIVTKPN